MLVDTVNDITTIQEHRNKLKREITVDEAVKSWSLFETLDEMEFFLFNRLILQNNQSIKV